MGYFSAVGDQSCNTGRCSLTNVTHGTFSAESLNFSFTTKWHRRIMRSRTLVSIDYADLTRRSDRE
jgi:hypothetical protein